MLFWRSVWAWDMSHLDTTIMLRVTKEVDQLDSPEHKAADEAVKAAKNFK